ncbi:hypothetical protein [Nannocystis pusilla]|uniref:Uncharacterized protein n=1 Tax=Nannocystis pusilla TaxID=889268 RepID=A0ABS7U6N8_9BACT|nr:hypothetical protein [Nannocystis pusilla]MBZ5716061.1 hypothetical protein [Nannocystis pusilla]
MRLGFVLLGLSLVRGPRLAGSTTDRERVPESGRAAAEATAHDEPGALRAAPDDQRREAAGTLDRRRESRHGSMKFASPSRAPAPAPRARPAAATGSREPQGVGAPTPPRWPLPRAARIRRSAALFALAVPTLATGVALVVLRTRSFERHVGSCALGADQPLCTGSAIRDHARVAAAGAGLVGAGLGLVAAGMTAAVPVRRRVWIAEAVVGGSALALGVAWLAAERVAYRPGAAREDLARLGPWFERRAVAASLLGAGLGLALGAGVGLLPPARRAPRSVVAPTLLPPGLAVVGRF